MDLNGDGRRDIITGGSYGDIYLYPGLEDGTFGEQETLLHEDGEKINVSATSSPFAVDWDRDGDLDLLCGNGVGEVWFIPNISEGAAPSFGEKARIEGGGRVIRARSPGASGPYVCDWDGDGRHDLLVGGGNGAVHFYRNTTLNGIPDLAAPVELVEMSGAYARDQTHYDPKEDRGAYAKVHVADWNGDGRMDLLVGIIKAETEEPPELTRAEEAEKEQVEHEYYEASREYFDLRDDVSARVAKAMGFTSSTAVPPVQRAEYSEKMRVELAAAPGYEEIRARMLEVSALRQQFQPQHHVYGWVWVYLRK